MQNLNPMHLIKTYSNRTFDQTKMFYTPSKSLRWTQIYEKITIILES